eukprot:g31652.t1
MRHKRILDRPHYAVAQPFCGAAGSISGSMIVRSVRILCPLFLLGAAISRFNLFNLVFLFGLLSYFLAPPIYVYEAHWRRSKWWWRVMLFSFTAIFIAQCTFQILAAMGKVEDSETFRMIGLVSVHQNDFDGARNITVETLAVVLGFVAVLIFDKYSPAGQPPMYLQEEPSAPVDAELTYLHVGWVVPLFVALYFSGTCIASLANLVYFLAATGLMAAVATQPPLTFANVRRYFWCLLPFGTTHLILQYLYQIDAVEQAFPRKPADLIGLYAFKVDQVSEPQQAVKAFGVLALFFLFLLQAGLFRKFVGKLYVRYGDHDVDFHVTPQRAPSSSPPQMLPDPRRVMRTASCASLHSQNATVSRFSSAARDTFWNKWKTLSTTLGWLARRNLHAYGRLLTHSAMMVSVLWMPNGLNVVNACVLAMSMLVTSRALSALLPLMYTWLFTASLLLYLWTVPNLLPSNTSTREWGLHYYQIPFIPIFQLYFPVLAIAIHHWSKQHKEGLTWKNLKIAATSNDIKTLHRAVRQGVPLTAAGHRKLERAGAMSSEGSQHSLATSARTFSRANLRPATKGGPAGAAAGAAGAAEGRLGAAKAAGVAGAAGSAVGAAVAGASLSASGRNLLVDQKTSTAGGGGNDSVNLSVAHPLNLTGTTTPRIDRDRNNRDLLSVTGTIPRMKSRPEHREESLLHLAARYGSVDCAKMLVAHLNVNARDHHGDTALHVAHRHRQHVIVEILCARPEIEVHLTNDQGQTYSQTALSLGQKVWYYTAEISSRVNIWLWKNAYYACMCALYVVGMYQVSLVNMIYLLFFLAFIAEPHFARYAWFSLALYCALVFATKYALYVFSTPVSWAITIGMQTENMEKKVAWALFPYYFIFISAAIQLAVYRNKWNQGPAMWRPSAGLGRRLTLLASYMTLVAEFLLGDISLLNYGYVCIFLVAMLIHLFSAIPARRLWQFWFLVVGYTGLVLAAKYAYCFPWLQNILKERWGEDDDVWLFDLSMADIGFNTRPPLQQLIGPTAVFLTNVFAIRALLGWKNERPGEEFRMLDRARRKSVKAGASRWERFNYFFKDMLNRFLEHLLYLLASHLLLIIYVWLLCSTFQPVAFVTFAYLGLIALVMPFTAGRLVWLPLAFISPCVFSVRYLFQLPDMFKGAETPTTAWWGLFRYDEGARGGWEIAKMLCSDLFVLVVAVMVRVLQRRQRRLAAETQIGLAQQAVLDNTTVNETKDDSTFKPFLEDSTARAPTELKGNVSFSAQETADTKTGLDYRAGPSPVQRQFILLPDDPQPFALPSGFVLRRVLYGDQANWQQRGRSVDVTAEARQRLQQGLPLEASSELWRDPLPQEPRVVKVLVLQLAMEQQPAPSLKPSHGALAYEPPDPVPMASSEIPEEPKQQQHWFMFWPFWSTFTSIVYTIVVDFLWHFIKNSALQLTISLMIAMSIYRQNILCVLYVCILVPTYMYFGALVMRRIWPCLIALLCAALLWQYAIVLGYPPHWAYPEYLPPPGMSEVEQAFWLVGALTVEMLQWDWWIYFCSCLQRGVWLQADQKAGQEGPSSRSTVSDRPEHEEQRPFSREVRFSRPGSEEAAGKALVELAAAGIEVTNLKPSSQLEPASEAMTSKGLMASSEASVVKGLGQEQGVEYDKALSAVGATRQESVKSLEEEEAVTGAIGYSEDEAAPATGYTQEEALELTKLQAQNTWDSIAFGALVMLDRFFILIIFFLSTYNADLLRCGYLVFFFKLLFSSDLNEGNDAQMYRRWHHLQWYNIFVIALNILYQIPYLPDKWTASGPIPGDIPFRWSEVIGLHTAQDLVDLWQNMVIFLLVDVMLMVLKSDSFLKVRRYFEEQRLQSHMKGAKLNDKRERTRLRGVAAIDATHAAVRREFRRIFLKVTQHIEDAAKIMLERQARMQAQSLSGGAKRMGNEELEKASEVFFQDEQVWAQEPPPDWTQQKAKWLLLTKPGQELPQQPPPPPQPQQQAIEQQQQQQQQHQQQQQQQQQQQPTAQQAEQTAQAKPQPAGNPTTTPAAARESERAELAPPSAAPSPSKGALNDTVVSPQPAPVSKSQSFCSKLNARLRAFFEPKINPIYFATFCQCPIPAGKASRTLPEHPRLYGRQTAVTGQPDPFILPQPTHKYQQISEQPDYSKFLLINIMFRVLVSHSEKFAYFIFFLAFFLDGSLLSAIVPLACWAYALIENPMPPKSFWTGVLWFKALQVWVLFLFQLPCFCITGIQYTYALAPDPACSNANPPFYSTPYLLGVYKVSGSASFFWAIFGQVMTMWVVVWHRSVLMQMGLWDRCEDPKVQQLNEARLAALEEHAKALEVWEEQELERQEAEQRLREQEEEAADEIDSQLPAHTAPAADIPPFLLSYPDEQVGQAEEALAGGREVDLAREGDTSAVVTIHTSGPSPSPAPPAAMEMGQIGRFGGTSYGSMDCFATPSERFVTPSTLRASSQNVLQQPFLSRGGSERSSNINAAKMIPEQGVPVQLRQTDFGPTSASSSAQSQSLRSQSHGRSQSLRGTMGHTRGTIGPTPTMDRAAQQPLLTGTGQPGSPPRSLRRSSPDPAEVSFASSFLELEPVPKPLPPDGAALCLDKYTRTLLDYVPWEIARFFLNIIPYPDRRVHMLKPGQDYYTATAWVEIFCSFYIILFYSSMASTSINDVKGQVSSNLFSGGMVLTFFVQILSLVYDRAVFLRRSLIKKLLWQFVTLGLWTWLAVMQWPKQAMRGWNENMSLRFFYLLKSIYFTLSALQLRAGWVEVECQGFGITDSPSTFRGFIFKTYRAIPFLFELEVMLDYMFVDSALDLWEMFKLEDVYATLYSTWCNLTYMKKRGRGEQQTACETITYGWLFFLGLLAVLMLPFLLFSNLNPSNINNPLESATVEFSLYGKSTGSFELLSIGSATSLRNARDDEYQQLRAMGLVDETSNQESCQLVSMANNSDTYWVISPPALGELIASLRDPNAEMSAIIRYSFTRKGPPTSRTVTSEVSSVLSRQKQEELANLISGDVNDVAIPSLIPAYFRLAGDAAEAGPVSEDHFIWLNVDYSSKEGENLGWWTLRNGTSTEPGTNLAFLTISNPILGDYLSILSVIQGASITAFYAVVAAAVGSFVRGQFGGSTPRIIYEDMQDVDDLIAYCQAIYVARRSKELVKEEALYRRLIKMFRTPDLLVTLTQREKKPKKQSSPPSSSTTTDNKDQKGAAGSSSGNGGQVAAGEGKGDGAGQQQQQQQQAASATSTAAHAPAGPSGSTSAISAARTGPSTERKAARRPGSPSTVRRRVRRDKRGTESRTS